MKTFIKFKFNSKYFIINPNYIVYMVKKHRVDDSKLVFSLEIAMDHRYFVSEDGLSGTYNFDFDTIEERDDFFDKNIRGHIPISY